MFYAKRFDFIWIPLYFFMRCQCWGAYKLQQKLNVITGGDTDRGMRMRNATTLASQTNVRHVFERSSYASFVKFRINIAPICQQAMTNRRSSSRSKQAWHRLNTNQTAKYIISHSFPSTPRSMFHVIHLQTLTLFSTSMKFRFSLLLASVLTCLPNITVVTRQKKTLELANY